MEWEQDVRARSKREDKSSQRGSDSDRREREAMNPVPGILHVVVRFEGEGVAKNMDPLKLTKIMRAQVGEIKYVRVLKDGNLLIGCKEATVCGES